MHKLKFFKTKKGVAVLVAVAGIIIVVSLFGGKNQPAIKSEAVERRNVEEVVSVVGKTKPVDDVRLAFEVGGRVSAIHARIGDAVTPGMALVSLDTTELNAQLKEAEASLDAERAILAASTRGARPEDIQITKTQLSKAEQDLANDYGNVLAALADGYGKADDAVRNQVSALFSNAELSNPQLTFTTYDSQIQTDVQFQRFVAGTRMNAWKTSLSALQGGTTPEMLDAALVTAQENLALVLAFLNKTVDAVTDSITLSAATVSTYKTNITTARNAVTVAITSVNGASQEIASQKIVVQQYRDQLTLQLAGTSVEDIRTQEAKVRKAEASVQLIKAKIGKMILRSPIRGVVTAQDAKEGEIATAQAALVRLISASNFEIEAYIPEADIAKVKVGNEAKASLDAFGNSTVFHARIIAIDPAETVIEGVPTYKARFEFTDGGDRIRSGMTADLDISTARRENTLAVPRRALIDGDHGYSVKILNGETAKEVPVEVGLFGSEGYVEIVRGLEEGARVITL